MGLMELRRMMMESGPHEIPSYETAGPADVVTFESNWAMPMRSLKVDIDPVQDLHGYDNPWPAGGGKNLFDPSSAIVGMWDTNGTYDSSRENYVTIYCKVKPNTTYTLSISGSSFDNQRRCFFNRENPTTFTNRYVGYDKTFTTASDTVLVSFSPSKESFESATNIMVEEGSTATAWTPYSNICPISGWTGAEVQRTGANVWDEEWVNGRWADNSGVLNTAFTTYVACKNKIPVKPNTTYYLCVDISTITGRELVWYDKNGNWISDGPNTFSNAPFTTPNNAYFMTFNLGGGYGATYNNDISINYPSTDHDYHEGHAKTVNVSWETEAGTVYGGTLDAVTGELVVDRASVDLGTLTWAYASANSLFYSSLPLGKLGNNTKGYWAICSNYQANYDASFAGWGAFPNKTVSAGCQYDSSTYKNLVIKDTAYTDETSFKSAMDGVQLVYELAEPITDHLTPTEVRTLLGQNNVWADTGQVEVQYWVKD